MLALFVLAAAVTPPAVAAVDAAIKVDDDATQACYDKAQSHGEKESCAGAEFQRSMAALKLAWSNAATAFKHRDVELMSDGYGFTAKALQNLTNGQRAWVAYRGSTCRAVESWSSDSNYSAIHFETCMADITWKRVKELAQLTIDPNSGEQM